MYDTIIIGGGPAGLTAAIYVRRAGLSALLCEAAVCGGQIINSPEVDNFPARPHVSGWQLA
ncbi:MAG: FAD-dependent oxidoreductase, partial [Oscillospiraceae bacterium]|nr:FAD-dependent oxidoreductase [Oscillospiraceae bacterium]